MRVILNTLKGSFTSITGWKESSIKTILCWPHVSYSLPSSTVDADDADVDRFRHGSVAFSPTPVVAATPAAEAGDAAGEVGQRQ